MTEKMSAADFRALRNPKPSAGTQTPAEGRSASRRKKTGTPTNSLTAAIIQLLTLEGCTVWRQNNAAVYDPNRQCFRANSATPGISDVLGYHRATGRFLAVEVKTGRDKLSPEQTRFLKEVADAGGFACEGRTLDQVRQEYQQWLTTLARPY